MAVLEKSFGDTIYTRDVKFTKRGKDSLGASHYTIHTAIKEIVNNFIVGKSFFERYKRLVKGQVVIDTTNMKLHVIDDMSGWDEKRMTEAMDMGVSLPTEAIMSRYGMGLKYLIPYFGELEEIRTCRDGKKYFSMLVDDTSDYVAHRVVKSNEPLKRFNVETQEWEKFDGCGSMMTIDLKNKHLFGDVRVPKNLTEILQDSYRKYLGKTLSLEVIWMRDDKVAYHEHCRKHTPLKAAERLVQEDVINPDTKKPYEFIDKARLMGPDEWELDEMYKCPKTGYVVELQIGFVPNPKNVIKHYEQSKDPKYNPDTYKNNIYRYGGKFCGLTYSQEGVGISGGKFSMDRKAGIYGTIDIIKGIETTSDKTAIERTSELDDFEYELIEFLRVKKILVRSTATANRYDEDEMEEKLMERLKKSSKLRKWLEVDGYTFDNQYSGCTSGIPDIVALDGRTVTQVKEIKKEGGRDLPSALFQGMSYCEELGIKDCVIIAQDEELPSYLQIKVDIWNANGWKIRYYQYQTLTSQKLFPND